MRSVGVKGASTRGEAGKGSLVFGGMRRKAAERLRRARLNSARFSFCYWFRAGGCNGEVTSGPRRHGGLPPSRVAGAPRTRGRPPSGGKTVTAERDRPCAPGRRFPNPQPGARGVGPGGRGWRRPPAPGGGKGPGAPGRAAARARSGDGTGPVSPEPAELQGPREPHSPLCAAAPSPAAPLTCT